MYAHWPAVTIEPFPLALNLPPLTFYPFARAHGHYFAIDALIRIGEDDAPCLLYAAYCEVVIAGKDHPWCQLLALIANVARLRSAPLDECLAAISCFMVSFLPCLTPRF